MNINATVIGQIIPMLMLVIGGISYYLAKRKTTTPKLVTFVAVVLCLLPPLALIYVAALSLKKDISQAEPS